ncbi:hypothetical protein [Dyella sp. C9]|uniref:hypothetical protein n=1 Tax=Dyella sp. C9 TaxID=2202154 RepID=UPI000DEF0A86|nr:hypothetical protein [Dyella sp. C9]
MKKLILLLVLAGLAWWYFDVSRRMTDAQIRSAYDDTIAAMRRFDADALCNQLSDDFSGDEVTREGGSTTEQHYDKQRLCDRIRKSTALTQRISAATGGLVEPDVDVEIKNIELSKDRKEAIVQTVSTTRLGDMTLGRDRSTERLIRRNGHILRTGGESKVWVYTPQ